MGLVTVGTEDGRVFLRNDSTKRTIGMSPSLARVFSNYLSTSEYQQQPQFGPLRIRVDQSYGSLAVVFEENPPGRLFLVLPPDAIPLVCRALNLKARELAQRPDELSEVLLKRWGLDKLTTLTTQQQQQGDQQHG